MNGTAQIRRPPFSGVAVPQHVNGLGQSASEKHALEQ
jgi:hypothetical protein